MESTVCHFEIGVDDLGVAREFYNKLFGWNIAEAAKGAPEYLLIRTSEQPGALGGALLKRSSEEGGGVRLYVTVESIDAAVAKLEELGGTVVVPKAAVSGMGWTVLARDPQDNPIGLFQEDKEAS